MSDSDHDSSVGFVKRLSHNPHSNASATSSEAFSTGQHSPRTLEDMHAAVPLAPLHSDEKTIQHESQMSQCKCSVYDT
jgi:hypothetical protein